MEKYPATFKLCVGDIRKLYDCLLYTSYKYLEMNWVGDFNPQMMHLMDYLSAKAVKTHITYRKLFREDICLLYTSEIDRTHPPTIPTIQSVPRNLQVLP